MSTPAPGTHPDHAPLETAALPPAFTPGALGDAIARIWTDERVGLAFIKDWRSAWRHAYEVPARCVLTVLVLQRELRRAAEHSGYHAYAGDAHLNIARLEARLGVAPTPTDLVSSFERRFLDWVRTGTSQPPLPRRESSDTEMLTWQGVALLRGGTVRDLLAFADPETPQWLRNTPLGHVKDACRLTAVRRLCSEGREAQAAPYAAGCGMRGEAVARWIALRLHPHPERREETIRLASYQAYLCQREIERLRALERLRTLGHEIAIERVAIELAEWTQLGEQLAKGDNR